MFQPKTACSSIVLTFLLRTTVFAWTLITARMCLQTKFGSSPFLRKCGQLQIHRQPLYWTQYCRGLPAVELREITLNLFSSTSLTRNLSLLTSTIITSLVWIVEREEIRSRKKKRKKKTKTSALAYYSSNQAFLRVFVRTSIPSFSSDSINHCVFWSGGSGSLQLWLS